MNNRRQNVYRRGYYRRRYNNEAGGVCLALFFGVPLALIVVGIIGTVIVDIAQTAIGIGILIVLGIGGVVWIGIAIDKKDNQEYYRKLKEYKARQASTPPLPFDTELKDWTNDVSNQDEGFMSPGIGYMMEYPDMTVAYLPTSSSTYVDKRTGLPVTHPQATGR